MANALYDKGREAFAAAGINWVSDTIKCILVDTGEYTPNLATDSSLVNIPALARVGSAVTLSGKTNVSGVVDADDVSFTGLVSAPTVEALVIYKDTGVESTSTLIAYIDTGTALPVPAGASQINVAWDNGANKIFKL
jgi:hypothetical protein